MKHLNSLLIALTFLVAGVAMAQDTNDLKTQLGWFETRTNVVIIKSYGPVGGIALGAQELSVRCKQTVDTSTGEKVYGLVIECEGNAAAERMLVDDDEVDSLINAVNYLAKINSMPSITWPRSILTPARCPGSRRVTPARRACG
jgi:hypothetical protein